MKARQINKEDVSDLVTRMVIETCFLNRKFDMFLPAEIVGQNNRLHFIYIFFNPFVLQFWFKL